LSEFDRKVVDEVEKETRRLHVEVLGSLARVKAIEAAIEGKKKQFAGAYECLVMP
jgi:hypothetical protein